MSTTYNIMLGDTFESVSRKAYGTDSNTSLIISANPGVFEPLQVGTVIVIPDDANAPQNLKQNAFSNAVNEVAVLIDGERFRFWTQVVINLSIDSLPTISFMAPFKSNIVKPLEYNKIEITVGGDYVFTGTVISVIPRLGADIAEISIEAYALPGVLNDCTVPGSNFPLEYEFYSLKTIADSVIRPFSLVSQFDDSPGAVFDRVSIDGDRKVLDFLIDLANQRGLIISSTANGKLLFRKSLEDGVPVANLKQGASPLISIVPNFNSQEYYSHITGLEPVFTGLGGSQYTVKNTRLTKVVRPFNFTVPDTVDADVPQAVKAKVGRMFGNVVAYTLSVATWRDPQGDLWKDNTLLNVEASSVFINNPYTFLIRNVRLIKNEVSESAILDIVLPGAFSGKIPEVLPWD